MSSINYVVVPLFNEVERFQVEYWRDIVQHSDIEVLFVNDGSSDGTSKLVSEFVLNYGGDFLNLEKNFGKAEAVRKGFHHIFSERSENGSICYLDSDAAFDSEEVISSLKLYSYIGQCDRSSTQCGHVQYWSSRVKLAGSNIDRKLSRHYLNRIILTFLLFGIEGGPYDSQSGFKIFSNCHHTRELFDSGFKTRWLFDIELLLRVLNKSESSAPIFEFPIRNWRDVDGSKLGIRSSIRVFREIVQIISLRLVRPRR